MPSPTKTGEDSTDISTQAIAVRNGHTSMDIKCNGKHSHNDSGIDQDQSMESPLTPVTSASLEHDDSVFSSSSPLSPGTYDISTELELRMRGGSVGSSQRSADYGKFYTKSYLMENSAEKMYLKKSPQGPGTESSKVKSPQSFLRPDNFSYSKQVQYGKPTKKGAMGALVNSIAKKKPVAKPIESPVAKKSEEPIKLSQYPGGDKPKPNEVSKIERDDWPAPPSPAATLPQRMRERRKSKGDILEDEEEEVKIDPKTQKELDEITKLSEESPMSKVIVRDLARKVEVEKSRIMDPRSASRTPAADREPYIRTRYNSPTYASPSRLNIERPHSKWKEQEPMARAEKIQTLPHTPVIRPGYTYGLASGSKSATLPINIASFQFKDEDQDLSDDERSRSKSSSNPALDTETEAEHNNYKRRSYHSCQFEGTNFISSTLGLERRSLLTSKDTYLHEPQKTYSLDELKNPSGDLQKVLDSTNLERYLSNEDFEETFNMQRVEFYRLPEWKRNDLKRKVKMFN